MADCDIGDVIFKLIIFSFKFLGLDGHKTTVDGNLIFLISKIQVSGWADHGFHTRVHATLLKAGAEFLKVSRDRLSLRALSFKSIVLLNGSNLDFTKRYFHKRLPIKQRQSRPYEIKLQTKMDPFTQVFVFLVIYFAASLKRACE